MKKLSLPILALLMLGACGNEKKAEPKPETCEKKNVTVETIMNRRSYRSYQPTQIEKAQLDTIIQCAINAPSARNLQTWEIRVIQNQELIKEIDKGSREFFAKKDPKGNSIDSTYSFFYHSPTVILVANDTEMEFSQVDCGLLGENILLAAESMNIGTCVVGSVARYLVTPEANEIIKKLNLPKNFKPLYAIAMGYKNEKMPDAKPRSAEKVKWIE